MSKFHGLELMALTYSTKFIYKSEASNYNGITSLMSVREPMRYPVDIKVGGEGGRLKVIRHYGLLKS